MTDFRLHTFLAVCREKSFTRAAETLGLTQPAVSQHIQYLEDDLGQKLLSVHGRAITLTEAGTLLCRFAERTEAEAERTRERIAASGNRRAFRCGATRTIGEFVLPECLSGWYRDRPDIEVSMTVDNSERLFALLREGALDFLFVEGPFVRDEFSASTLLRDSLALVCAPTHPLAGRSVPFDDVLGETLIVREEGSGSRRLVEGLLAGHNLALGSFRRVLEIGNVGAIKRLVADGAGIAFLYAASVPEIGATGTLARIPARGASLSHEYAFACRKDSLYESEYRAFFEYCRSRVGAGKGSEAD